MISEEVNFNVSASQVMTVRCNESKYPVLLPGSEVTLAKKVESSDGLWCAVVELSTERIPND